MGDEDGYTGGTGTGEGNPAWQEFYDVVPADIHDKVTPLLQKWDQGVQERFTKVQSDYEPWKDLIDNKVDPADAKFAIQLLNGLEQNPQEVYKAIGEYYKLANSGSGSGQGHVELKTEPEEPQYATASDLAALRQQNEIMAQILLRNREAEDAKANDARLDSEFAAAKQKYGDFDERYVSGLLLANPKMTVDQGVASFKQFVTTEAAKYRPKPLFMGAGGGVPGQQTDVSKLNDKQRKELAVNILKAANAERNQ